jgi:hypothetical protein
MNVVDNDDYIYDDGYDDGSMMLMIYNGDDDR